MNGLSEKWIARFTMVVTLAIVVGLILATHTRSTVTSAQQMKVRDDADFSKFKHESEYHARLPCLLCHRRESNSVRPSFPGADNHAPCTGCHAKQFADNSSPICLNCHSNAQSGALKSFPKLASFNVKFDHAQHRQANCATCHRPARSGVAMSFPSGVDAHATCFRCHTAQAKSGDRDISSCGVCHQAGRHTRPSLMARAFRVGFSHAKHNADERLSCNDCHRVRAGFQKEVTSPQPLNHHASPRTVSCMTCHNGKRAFGGDDFKACQRCHTKGTWHF